ncbi:MAG: hypothetical protein M3340_12795 [Actinomycetota bacterium]|nr:hypothetical protein [Actinomycetota bacterium]
MTFDRPVRVGDDLGLEIDVDRMRELTPERVVVETTWRIVNQLGETLGRLHADVVCRRSRSIAPMPSPELFARDAFASEFDCVDNIPI